MLALAAVLVGLSATAWIVLVDPASHFATGLGFVALAILAIAVVAPFRFRPRAATLEVRPGEVEVHAGFARSFVVRARDVTGSTTSRLPGWDQGGGCVVTLGLRQRGVAPVSLVLARDEDGAAVRAALGVGHDGRGETAWPAQESGTVRAGQALGLTAAVIFCYGAALCAMHLADGAEGPMPSPEVVTMGATALVALFASLVRFVPGAAPLHAALRSDGARLQTARGYAVVPYSAMQDVVQQGGALWVHADVLGILAVKRVHPDELGILSAHLLDARRRARGEGTPRVEVAQRLFPLARNGDSVRAWLARGDALASTLGAGYRGSALTREDLHVALEDPDLELELRVAGARALARVEPEVRVRLGELAASSATLARGTALRVASSEPEVVERALEEAALEEVAGVERARLGRPG